MRKCPACGKEFRSGRRAILLTAEGAEGKIVCQSCSDKGLLVVPPKIAPTVVQKVERNPDVDKVVKAFLMRAKMAKATAATAEDEMTASYLGAKAETWEAAADTLKKELLGR